MEVVYRYAARGSVADPHPDPACHFDADPGPDPSFKLKALNLEKVLKYAHIPYVFLLVICKLMRIRIRIQRITLMLMRIQILPFNVMRIHEDPDPQHLQEVKAFQGKCHQKRPTVPVLVWNLRRIETPSSQEILNCRKIQVRKDYSGSGKRLRNRPNLDLGSQRCFEVLIGFQHVICPWASGKIKSVLCRVSDPDWIRIQSDHWIRIRTLNTDPDPGGQKWPTKVEKIQVLKCWMASFVSWRLLLYPGHTLWRPRDR